MQSYFEVYLNYFINNFYFYSQEKNTNYFNSTLVLCFIFSFTISRFIVDAYAQSIAENKFVSGTIISFYLPSLSSKNNDFVFNIRTDNKNVDTISAIVNDTNINITQFKIDASVCVKINYSNNFFFKDFHYKNYIVDCNQTFNNDKNN